MIEGALTRSLKARVSKQGHVDRFKLEVPKCQASDEVILHLKLDRKDVAFKVYQTTFKTFKATGDKVRKDKPVKGFGKGKSSKFFKLTPGQRYTIEVVGATSMGKTFTNLDYKLTATYKQ